LLAFTVPEQGNKKKPPYPNHFPAVESGGSKSGEKQGNLQGKWNSFTKLEQLPGFKKLTAAKCREAKNDACRENQLEKRISTRDRRSARKEKRGENCRSEEKKKKGLSLKEVLRKRGDDNERETDQRKRMDGISAHLARQGWEGS